MTREEIIEYIKFRASGINQAINYDYEEFYKEMLEMCKQEKQVKQNDLINNLHDLIELGIKLHRNGLPKGFIISLKCNPKQRDQIYSDILDLTNEAIDYVYLKGSDKCFHRFKYLGMSFNLF